MERNARLTLVGLGTVAGLILFVILLAIPALNLVKKIAIKNVCGTNLKGLGTAMTVYANDYDDMYPQLPGTGPWSEDLGFPFFLDRPDFSNAQFNTLRNISASLYLLVREADVSPTSFICPYSEMQPFDGDNPDKKDIVDLWDFGNAPHSHVSYSYHNPYGKYPSDGTRSAAFAVAADMSPWFKNGNFVLPGSEPSTEHNRPAIITVSDKSTWPAGNGRYHTEDGHNVLFADGHTSYETRPNVGVKNDNIYTYWSAEENPTEQDRQGGTAPTGRGPENDAKSREDSFLAI
jgi:prepilin-type processing-associated H-X9-DG protein